MGFRNIFRRAFNIEDEKADDMKPANEVQNFKYLDNLIHSGKKEIVLNCDIVADEDEQLQYLTGITIDVDGLTLDGNGHTIDGANTTRIFKNTSHNVIIKNLRLENGGMLYSSKLNTAGAIYNEGELSVQDCIFKSNISREDGGTILNSYSGILTINNTLIEGGNAGDGAGAIFNMGILKITNSKVHNNSSKWNYGGAIYNTKEMVIQNTSFKNNTNHGRDISDRFWRNMFVGIEYSDDIYNSGKATLVDVEFDTPSISIYNKGLFATNKGYEKIKGEKAIKFDSLGADERSFTFLSQLIQGTGDEIKLENDILLDVVNLEHLNFPDGIEIDADGLTIDGDGHAIDAQAMGKILSVTGKNVVMKNITLRNARDGAVINRGLVKIENALFEKNKRAILTCNDDLTVTESRFISNEGGIFGSATITNCEFTRNFEDNGAAVSGGGNIENCVFNHNSAKRGGAIVARQSSISKCVFNENSADVGGAISGGGNITNCIFNNNRAKDGKSIHANDEITITNSKFNEDESSKGSAISNASIMTFSGNEVNNGLLLNKMDAILKLYGDKENDSIVINNKGKIKAFNFKNNVIDFAEIENTGKIIFFSDKNENTGEFFTSQLKWIEIKIFISSTFKDMHSERDYLVSEVFPKLKEWCRQRRILLNEIDLRWGVTADDSKSGNTINVCLKSIDECHPFFLCFIGQRRGWVPSVEEININNDALINYPQLKESIGKLSITEMEIEHATLLPMIKILEKDSRENYSKQSVFFFRQNPFENVDLTSQQKAIYLNADEKDNESLESLKDLIRQEFPAFEYSCDWDENLITYELAASNAHQGRIVDFECEGKPLKDVIISELKGRIEDEFPNQKPIKSEDSYLDDAILHRLDVESHANECVGRERELEHLNDLMGRTDGNVVLIKGLRGIGKTTFLCRLNEMLKRRGFAPMMRICNTTPKSFSTNDLCLSIGSELGIFNGDEEKAKNNKYSINRAFIEKLKDNGVNFLILSDIDKIGKLDLKDIPSDFHIILESEMDYGEDVNCETFVLEGFETRESRLELIESYLERCLKNLDSTQKDIIISNPSSAYPLFLKIVLNEISLFGSYEELNDKLLNFGDSTKAAFEEVIRTIDSDTFYPEGFVKFTLLMLYYSKNGLNEEELTYGLSFKFDQGDLNECLMIFLRRIREYVTLTYDKYSIRYDELAQAISNQFGDLESDVRRILVEVYKKSMLSAPKDMTYYDIEGSTQLLYNLEVLGKYDEMIGVFKNDDLLDRVCPHQYLMEYKSGRFYYREFPSYAGFLIRGKSEGSEFFREISFALLKRANILLEQAPIKYPKPYKQWSAKFRKESPDDFARYRDTFYEMPKYVSASLKYAKMSFECEKDSNRTIKFWQEYRMDAHYLIHFFKVISDDGAEYLGLSHQVEDLAFSAKMDYDRIDRMF